MLLDSSVFAVVGFAIALAVAAALERARPMADADPNRYQTIDGLRGFLAFGVFVHHAVVWKVQAESGQWEMPASHLYAHLGKSSTVLFFMVTAYLFTGKVIDADIRPISWRAFFIGRVFRLVPLYLVAFCAVLVIVIASSGFVLREPEADLFRHLSRWAVLAVFGMPDINGFVATRHIVASVPWTLRYEVLFYAALPVLAVLAGRKSSAAAIAFGVATICLIMHFTYMQTVPLELCLAFGCGVVAAYAARASRVGDFARSRLADVLIVLVGTIAVAYNDHGLMTSSVLSFGLIFLLIAAGSDLFGLLRMRAARLLGDVSYGLYLLHGIVLHVVIVHVVGIGRVAAMTPFMYWALIFATTPCIVFLSVLTYRFVEQPGIEAGRRLAHRIRGSAASPLLAFGRPRS